MTSRYPKLWDAILKRLVADKIFPQCVHRALFYGPPGTGKSTAAQWLFGFERVERKALHRQLLPEELFGAEGLRAQEGVTVTQFVDGPAATALRHGQILVLDEIDAFSPDCRCLLHSLLDDLDSVCIPTADGEKLRAVEGYGVIATTNRPPDVLPDAILDRFDIILEAKTVAVGAMETMLNGSARRVVASEYKQIKSQPFARTVSFRRMSALSRLLGAEVPAISAAQMVFGGNGDAVLASLVAQESVTT